jgi:phytanoyl-CoA hydroxylase
MSLVPTDISEAALTSYKSEFDRQGYVVVPGVLENGLRQRLIDQVRQAMDPLVGPAEFEADVGYPGSPKDRTAPGGSTPRRLLHAYARSNEFKLLAMQPKVAALLQRLMGEGICLSQCHHNCIMTKHPGFSSATLWHQDIRYWSFQHPDLISAWYALGEETAENGALQVIPGTHLLDIEAARFDGELFLRPELPENQGLINAAETVSLSAGDMLLFHCRLFHAAGRNGSDAVKLSPVFTYHGKSNRPLPETRSDRFPSIEIDNA